MRITSSNSILPPLNMSQLFSCFNSAAIWKLLMASDHKLQISIQVKNKKEYFSSSKIGFRMNHLYNNYDLTWLPLPTFVVSLSVMLPTCLLAHHFPYFER